MSEESVKFEGRLALNRRECTEIQLRLQGLVRSLRDYLDPSLSVEKLARDLIVAQAVDFGKLHIKYIELLKEAAAINNLLGR